MINRKYYIEKLFEIGEKYSCDFIDMLLTQECCPNIRYIETQTIKNFYDKVQKEYNYE